MGGGGIGREGLNYLDGALVFDRVGVRVFVKRGPGSISLWM